MKLKRLFVGILLALLLAPQIAAAQVTWVGSQSTSWSVTTGTTLSANCTGTDRAAIILVSIESNAQSVSSITYGGVAATFVARASNSAAGPTSAEIWKISNPASGSQSVVITMSASSTGIITSACFNGAHQSTASLTGTAVTSNVKPPSINVTSAADEYVVDVLSIGTASTNVPTAGAGQTAITNVPGSSFYRHAASREPGAAGTVTMSWTGTMEFTISQVGVSVKPAAGGGGAPSNAARRRVM